ncbi:hypothetical protein [Symmachiella dynata]|uniref:Uncharacterized protein n=1 Tax=Symmachiella dynata TaxID=2527995 RepID=A0A517ZRS2_9PLAN|nr:hypothetical protein [Symmachiella dynata]QDT49515.1 hypothetical protein Pan258_35660 [Symmachiella dynata]QDU45168.1 hypothetical protein Mal52_36580 [Symmachiella dynata]
MSNTHLPIQHLLAQLEKQGRRPRRNYRPQWITPIIEEVAELFEPLCSVGRVGFDCRLTEDRWEVSLYLGTCELVGGKNDGQNLPLSFQFDMHELYRRFNLVERWEWTAHPAKNAAFADEEASLVTIEGYWDDNPIRLKLIESPPSKVGPGLREFPNGHREQI